MSLDDEFEMPPQEAVVKLMVELGLTNMNEKTHLSTKLCGKMTAYQINMAWLQAIEHIRKFMPLIVAQTTWMVGPVFIRKLLALAKQDAIYELGCTEGLWKKK